MNTLGASPLVKLYVGVMLGSKVGVVFGGLKLNPPVDVVLGGLKLNPPVGAGLDGIPPKLNPPEVVVGGIGSKLNPALEEGVDVNDGVG